MILDGAAGGDARASSRASSAPTAAASGSSYLRGARARPASGGRARLGLEADRRAGSGPVGDAARTSTATRTTCSRRCCSRPAPPPSEPIREAVAALDADERRRAARRPRRRARQPPPPARAAGFEALRYRFEIVADYGAFRDLQRHRMLTVQWQSLTPDLGAGRPRAGRAGRLRRRVPPRARALARASTSGSSTAGLRQRRALRAVPRLPDPVRARPQRPRGDAADRAALRARGPPELPRGRPRDARPDRRRPPGGRGGDDPRRPRDRAAARADPVRDARSARVARSASRSARSRSRWRSSIRRILPVSVFGRSVDELDQARVGVGREAVADERLDLLGELVGGLVARRRARRTP